MKNANQTNETSTNGPRTLYGQPYDLHRYDELPREDLLTLLRVKDSSISLFQRYSRERAEVIDLLARKVGLDPDTCGLDLYCLAVHDGNSPIAEKMDAWFDRSGEKPKLKRRIDELERENAYLRSLIQVKR